MKVKDLKGILEQIDEERMVIFEYQKDGESAKESFSIDMVEERFDCFAMLVSIEEEE